MLDYVGRGNRFRDQLPAKLTRDITDTETIDLPRGIWFVKLDEITRKVVVE